MKVSGLHPSKSSVDIYTTKSRKLKEEPTDLFTLQHQNDDFAMRPSTVGYSFSPVRKLFGRTTAMLEDRNLHINGSLLEQQQEVTAIT
jgi:hypothetical protein